MPNASAAIAVVGATTAVIEAVPWESGCNAEPTLDNTELADSVFNCPGWLIPDDITPSTPGALAREPSDIPFDDWRGTLEEADTAADGVEVELGLAPVDADVDWLLSEDAIAPIPDPLVGRSDVSALESWETPLEEVVAPSEGVGP